MIAIQYCRKPVHLCVCHLIAFRNPAIQAELQQQDPDGHDSDVDIEIEAHGEAIVESDDEN